MELSTRYCQEIEIYSFYFEVALIDGLLFCSDNLEIQNPIIVYTRKTPVV
jgi:hypothetical protein